VEVRSLTAAEAFVTADGSTIRELFGVATGGTRNQSLAEATLAPGQSTRRHYHVKTEEIYFVLDGEGEMELDGERRRVIAGDAVAIPLRAWHEIRATGERPLRFLCCCAQPYLHDDTFFE
jgi:mannose-6-phosphate isomerase-like protein (cupin superfamily)